MIEKSNLYNSFKKLFFSYEKSTVLDICRGIHAYYDSIFKSDSYFYYA